MNAICIPTYNRFNIKDARTIKILSTYKISTPVFLVVRRSQLSQYQMLIDGLPLVDLRWVITGDDGLVQARNDGLSSMQSQGVTKGIFLDDDVAFSRRVPNGSLITVKSRKLLVSLFGFIFDLLDKYAHAGLSTRVANRPHIHQAFKEVGRAHTCVGYRLDVLKSEGITWHGSQQGKSGLSMTLKMLGLGYPNAVIYRYSVNSCAATSVCDNFDTDHSVEISRELVGRYPNVVSPVWMNYKLGRRMEVRVAWKKALRQPPIYLD